MRKILLVLVSIVASTILYAQPMQFRNIGPKRGGRVTAVSGVTSKPNVYYMGATGGGLWKTTDYGNNWENISDGYFESPSIGAIAVFQKKPEIIYVGTGSDGIRSNVIVGRGVYKSIDAGLTWKGIGLEDAGQIGAVLIHPNNPEVAYVAALGQPFRKSLERGVYKTEDGGQSWDLIFHHSDSVGAVDLEFAPNNPDVIYACMWRGERKPWTIISGGATDGIFKSIDGGASWKPLEKGLPSKLIGKSDLAVSKSMPSRVWAQIQASDSQDGIYRSDDYGESWIKIKMPDKVHKSVMYRPFYFTNIDASPQNADNIWAGTKKLWTSYNGGESWNQIIPPHSDHHDLWINPVDSMFMIVGNDGGASVSIDGGKKWSTQFNQPTAELYTCDVDDQYPFYVYSGQQDNTTIRVPSNWPRQNVLNSNDNHGLEDIMFWERVGGCETGPAVPKPGNPDIVYSNCKGQFSIYNHYLGKEFYYYIGAESLYGNHPDDITYRFQRVTPLEVSPHDANTVYYGSQYLHKTSNGGVNWKTISGDLTANDPKFRMRSGEPIDEDISGEEYYAVLYAIQESPIQQGIIWTGSNDGLVHITKDGGENWEDVTPDISSGGRVQNIEASPHDPATAYVAINRDYLGDEGVYFLKTKNFGATWELLNKGIPDGHVARVIREDPNRRGLLFAGTEFGFYISYDDGASWNPFQRNLPIVPITDVRIHRKNLVLSTLGRSFWIMEDISPLHQFKNPEKKSLKLFEPRASIKPNQKIYFTIPENPIDSMVTFTISKDDVVIHEKQESINKLNYNSITGLRNTEWNLRWYFKRPNYNDFEGPLVAPGNYDLKMSYSGEDVFSTIKFLLHPKLKEVGISMEDLKEQENLSVKIARLYLKIEKIIIELEKALEHTTNQSKKLSYQKQLAELKKGPNRYDKPKLIDHVEYLLGMCMETQQKLGNDAFNRYKILLDKTNRILNQ